MSPSSSSAVRAFVVFAASANSEDSPSPNGLRDLFRHFCNDAERTCHVERRKIGVA